MLMKPQCQAIIVASSMQCNNEQEDGSEYCKLHTITLLGTKSYVEPVEPTPETTQSETTTN